MTPDDAKRIEEIRERAQRESGSKSIAKRTSDIIISHDIPWLLAQLAAAHAEIARLQKGVEVLADAGDGAALALQTALGLPDDRYCTLGERTLYLDALVPKVIVEIERLRAGRGASVASSIVLTDDYDEYFIALPQSFVEEETHFRDGDDIRVTAQAWSLIVESSPPPADAEGNPQQPATPESGAR